jgi:hypothetical protein
MTHQADSPVISEYTNLNKIVGGGEGKRKYPRGKGSILQDSVCGAYKKQSERGNTCKFCVVPLHKGSCFEKYHSVSNY